MLKESKVTAVIPARSGSKRLPKKNILPLAGKPMIAWTIEAALGSGLIDEVIVSTNSEEVKAISLKYGAKVPFLRPKTLSSDTASTDDVLLHAIQELQLDSTDIIVLLQPTSPLRSEIDIDASLSLLQDQSLCGVVTVCECEHSPLWSNCLPTNHRMGNFIEKEHALSRSQDLATYYRLNGAVYGYKVAYLEEHKSRYYSDKIVASIMSKESSIDVDTKMDFEFAEFLLQRSS
ncbi:acylneuraminate cytidylyltransferase family protein [Vibrio sp. VB16]|uniref:acylneuraminate cytidylyltransferase family protein n=1 Tax=Vibrio sp. VB16 TaxID=2785746 RepID=UPI00189E76B9|nr:acylneuraminate cytidylyltransferase family protein [Vibrio sp. VB16]UGA57359.1 acylneuraminate cytidylyltransferase family protein [Vibrio sp. VB16]